MKKSTGLLLCGALSLGLFGFAGEAKAAEVVKDGKTYWKVESNDTLSEIGNHYGISYFDIAAVNSQIKDVNLIYDGDLLLIPLNGEVAESTYVAPVEAPVVEEQAEEVSAPEPAPSYSAPSGGGHLTPSAGVFYGPSGKETYYSQRV